MCYIYNNLRTNFAKDSVTGSFDFLGYFDGNLRQNTQKLLEIGFYVNKVSETAYKSKIFVEIVSTCKFCSELVFSVKPRLHDNPAWAIEGGGRRRLHSRVVGVSFCSFLNRSISEAGARNMRNRLNRFLKRKNWLNRDL